MRRRAGITLVEVMMAMAMVVILFLGLAMIFPTGLGSLRKSQDRTVASNLAKALMESYATQDFSILRLKRPAAQTLTTIDGCDYTQTVHLIYPGTISGVEDPNLIEIHVQVAWNSGGTYGPGQVQYSTCVFNVANPL